MTTKSTASASQTPPADTRGRRRLGRAGDADRGTAYIGTLVGSAIFLFFLLLAVQTIVHLFATSTVSAAAYDAAHAVATDPGRRTEEIPRAEALARQKLGGLGRRVRFNWEEVDGQQVVLEVSVRTPGFLPFGSSLMQIDRRIVVRTERFR
ncbi:MAG: hypothetical protein J2P58_12280 [Acidimicrobiaceae bacterium]|nr:hypothetical protein [Acidimicrobiaceae bacterium]